MSNDNGVIRVGRKGIKKFAFGEHGEVFSVDVVVAFQEWVTIDDTFRERTDDRSIVSEDMKDYHIAAVAFVERLSGNDLNPLAKAMVAEHEIRPPIKITTAEALDFIARLQECYEEVAAFFRPKSREEPDLQGSTVQELRFSQEPS